MLKCQIYILSDVTVFLFGVMVLYIVKLYYHICIQHLVCFRILHIILDFANGQVLQWGSCWGLCD